MFKLFMMLALLVGCGNGEEIKPWVDYKSFRWFGGTLFSKPVKITTKEVHFGLGQLLGREVILEGEVTSVGKFVTHMIVRDQQGQLLVVTRSLGFRSELQAAKKPIRILGSVEQGKRGLPYLLARSATVKPRS